MINTRTLVLFIAISCSISASKKSLARVYGGECKLKLEPTPENYTKIWPNICIRGMASVHHIEKVNLDNKKLRFVNKRSSNLYFARVYSSINAWHSASYHFQGTGFSEYSSNKPISLENRYTDYSFLQIGNPYISNNSLSIGKIDLPFGLNHRPLDVPQFLIKKNFWPTKLWGLRASQSNHNLSKYEIGVALGREEPNTTNIQHSEIQSTSFRASLDIPALEGTKLLFSALYNQNNDRSYGGAILNFSQGATTSLEWIRVYLARDQNIEFEQLFRLNYISKKSSFSQFIFQYENSRKEYWLMTYQPVSYTHLTLPTICSV